MVIIDPSVMAELRKVFPRVSDNKIEIVTYFVYGMTCKDIAFHKGVSHQAVSKVLREFCEMYNISKLDMVKAVYAVRLELYKHLRPTL